MINLIKIVGYFIKNIGTFSYWICLSVALLSALFYALGFKKAAKYIPASIVVYVLMKALGGAF